MSEAGLVSASVVEGFEAFEAPGQLATSGVVRPVPCTFRAPRRNSERVLSARPTDSQFAISVDGDTFLQRIELC